MARPFDLSAVIFWLANMLSFRILVAISTILWCSLSEYGVGANSVNRLRECPQTLDFAKVRTPNKKTLLIIDLKCFTFCA